MGWNKISLEGLRIYAFSAAENIASLNLEISRKMNSFFRNLTDNDDEANMDVHLE